MLELINISKIYGNTAAVNDVSLNIESGEFFCLLGPSGCGKTTILRMIAGFENISSGKILLDGEDIAQLPPYKRNVNTVFQNYALFPNYNVFDNVAYGLKIKKLSKQEISKNVDEGLAMVGLTGYEKRMPSQLSGGQQQRVALARAIVNKPKILLLDEPLSALDKKIAEQTRIELITLQRKLGITFIFVTHNQQEALTLSDRIAVMKNGFLLQCDNPQTIYESPNNYFTADFIGTMNFFDGEILDINGQNITIKLLDRFIISYKPKKKTNFNIKDKIIFGLRPEQMKIGLLEPKDYENGIEGIIESQIFIGEITKYIIKLENNQKITANILNYLVLDSKVMPYDMNERIFISWSKNSGVILENKK
ncbi:MAG TPA: ABC transporter ATP-binding protein [bacterium]|nr:ABC transporter ATP-binding protein [bacterium]HPN29949.1 ABC transporter ATP-binding protein [bacterium]